MVQSHEAPAWKGRILRHKINFFVLGTFQKPRHPKTLGRSLGTGERFVMFVQLFVVTWIPKESACSDFRSCSVDTVPFSS